MVDQVAVLIMAYGGPNSLDDVEPYLLDVRGGRSTSPELVAEIRERYARIGGRSPLLDITRAQARALMARLNEGDTGDHGPKYRVYVGMRHWDPYIREAVGQIVQDGIGDVAALCMAPHYSKMSAGAYFQRLREAQEALGAQLNIFPVESWHRHPQFIAALAERVQAAQTKFSPAERDDLMILFTAHSLPAVLIEQGDPYEAQLKETACLLADRLGLSPERWQFCYQSAGATGARWLGPAVEDVIQSLCDEGRKHILVAPIGFVADHVEILFDLDVECREIAGACGAHLERTESLNTSPTFIGALADIVRSNGG